MIILASTSPYRKKLLSQLGIDFICQAPGVDETAAMKNITGPALCAQTLARLKAEAISGQRPFDMVIGADQVCCCDGQIFPQPGNRENAITQLTLLAGKSHQLHTAVCLKMPHQTIEFINTATLTMHALSKAEITAYVDLDRPYFCAGSYMIEQRGICLFANIATSDFTSIIGLPLLELAYHIGREVILSAPQKKTHT